MRHRPLTTAFLPEPEGLARWKDEDAERAMGMVCGIVSAVRSVRARYGISPKQELAVTVKAATDKDSSLIDEQRALIESLARLSGMQVSTDAGKPAESAATLVSGCEVYCELSGLVDFKAERDRLVKEQEKLQKEIAKVEKKLSESGLSGEGKTRNHREGQGEARRARGEVRSSGKPDRRACLNGIAPKERPGAACRILCDGYDRKTRPSGRVFRCRRLFRRMALFSGGFVRDAVLRCDPSATLKTGGSSLNLSALFAKGSISLLQ